MRIFRITCNPLDPYVLGGPGGNSVLLRLPFYLADKMFYAELRDGGYLRVPDADMGILGPALDTITLGGISGPLPAYRLFQDSVIPEGAVEADIPLWTTYAVQLAQPPQPMPVPTVWPVLNVVVIPG